LKLKALGSTKVDAGGLFLGASVGAVCNGQKLAAWMLGLQNSLTVEGKLRKYFSIVCQAAVLIGAVGCSLFGAPDSGREPVFVYLQADVTDHVNIDLTEDRLRRLLPKLEKFRQEHPQSHVSATVMFSGAVSDALAERNSQTHTVDFVKGYVSRGIVELGYDGADEPTYGTRPMLDFSTAKGVDARWKVRAAAAESLLTQGRDPLTGSVVNGKDGGLKRMQEVFGEAAYVTGLDPMINIGINVSGGPAMAQTKAATLPPPGTDATPKIPVPSIVPETGADTEIAHEVYRYNDKAIMPGLPEDNPAMIPGFGGGEEGFARLMSPSVNTSPEVYWQDGVLRLSEVSNTSEAAAEAENDYHVLSAGELKDDLKDLNRSKIHVVRVTLADERYYLEHKFTKDDEYALKYAYDHPSSPRLPSDQTLSKSEVDAAYSKEAGALDWLANEFFSVNPGSRFVSNADLREFVEPGAGYSVSLDGLKKGLADMLSKWGNDTFPPAFVEANDHYLSLADAFQVMTDAFAELDKSGKLPVSIRVVPVYGPLYTPNSHGPNAGEVTIASIAHAASGIAPGLHDTSGSAVPKNCIPTVVTVDDITMNSAQFLRLMASALVASSPDTKLRVRMTYMYPGQATLVPKTRAMAEMGASWTVKPAQLQIESVRQSARAQK
jgi:hypothetical protein